MKRFIMLLLLAVVIAACQRTEEEPATQELLIAESPTSIQVPLPTDIEIPTLTLTSTATPTLEPTNTPTETSTPTASSTPTATPTHTPSPTASATSTSTPIPPTPVPLAQVHLFPTTPIEDFSTESFLYQLGRTRDTFEELELIYTMISFGNTGNCIHYGGLHNLWTTTMPGYDNTSSRYHNLYVEYRSLLNQIVTETAEIQSVCSGGGGHVSEETDQAFRSFLEWSVPRLNQMVGEAQQIPG